jgi:3-(3-hydroxy-phenyl)propionate hydroxylase
MTTRDPVIISGGGPVAMILALALYRAGVPFIALETLHEPFMDQRAASYHPPTIEMLEGLGLTDAIIPEALKAPVYRFHDRVTREVVAEFNLADLEDELKFPYVLQYEQYKLARKILQLHGDKPDFDVRFSHTVVGFSQYDDHVDVEVERADGSRQTLRGAYLVGCDGGRSVVRKEAGIAFVGFTYPEKFIKIGTYFDFIERDDKVAYRNYFSDPEEWCNLFKVNGEPPKPGIWRCVIPMRVDETEEEAKSHDGIQNRLQRFFPKDSAYEIAYANVYTVSQCVAATFNDGRVVLAGDSAHVNNPIGGMGLNGGIHDAVNLAAKLAPLWKGGGGPELLDLYTRQRHKAAADFTQTQTIANKKQLEESDPATRKARLDELRAIGDDRGKSRQYMRRAQLIESLETAATVT